MYKIRLTSPIVYKKTKSKSMKDERISELRLFERDKKLGMREE